MRNDAYFTLKKPAKLILFQPHMHYRGKAMALEAIYPDRRVELLTYVDRFDVMWQVTYPYANPPVFPAGTVLHQTSWHDNSRREQAQPGSDQLGRQRQPDDRRDVDRPHRFHLPERRGIRQAAPEEPPDPTTGRSRSSPGRCGRADHVMSVATARRT